MKIISLNGSQESKGEKGRQSGQIEILQKTATFKLNKSHITLDEQSKCSYLKDQDKYYIKLKTTFYL